MSYTSQAEVATTREGGLAASMVLQQLFLYGRRLPTLLFSRMWTEAILAITTLKSVENAVDETDRRPGCDQSEEPQDFRQRADAGFQAFFVAAA